MTARRRATPNIPGWICTLQTGWITDLKAGASDLP